MAILAGSDECGSRGREIGRAVARSLGYAVLTKEVAKTETSGMFIEFGVQFHLENSRAARTEAHVRVADDSFAYSPRLL